MDTLRKRAQGSTPLTRYKQRYIRTFSKQRQKRQNSPKRPKRQIEKETLGATSWCPQEEGAGIIPVTLFNLLVQLINNALFVQNQRQKRQQKDNKRQQIQLRQNSKKRQIEKETKGEFRIAMSGQFCTLVAFSEESLLMIQFKEVCAAQCEGYDAENS